MWKALNYGEMVSAGDMLRYRFTSNNPPPQDETYIVFKTEQHYFELVRKTGSEMAAEPLGRKIVRLIDIGYNILLERWIAPTNPIAESSIPFIQI